MQNERMGIHHSQRNISSEMVKQHTFGSCKNIRKVSSMVKYGTLTFWGCSRAATGGCKPCVGCMCCAFCVSCVSCAFCVVCVVCASSGICVVCTSSGTCVVCTSSGACEEESFFLTLSTSMTCRFFRERSFRRSLIRVNSFAFRERFFRLNAGEWSSSSNCWR